MFSNLYFEKITSKESKLSSLNLTVRFCDQNAIFQKADRSICVLRTTPLAKNCIGWLIYHWSLRLIFRFQFG